MLSVPIDQIDLINTYRSAPVEKYLKKVKNILNKFQKKELPITKTSVAQEIGITVDTLNKYPEIIELIEETIKNYASKTFKDKKQPSKYFLGPSSENIRQIVENTAQSLINQRDKISFRLMSEKTGIYRQRLQEDQILRNIVENAITQQKNKWEEELVYICRQMINDRIIINYSTVAEKFGINRKKISRNKDVCSIVETYKELQFNTLIKDVKRCNELLIQSCERITFAKIARILNIHVKTISTNHRVRELIILAKTEQKKESSSTENSI